MTIQLVVPLDLEQIAEARKLLQVLWRSPWFCSEKIVSDHLENCNMMLIKAHMIIAADNFDRRYFSSHWHLACLKNNEYRVSYSYNTGMLHIDLPDSSTRSSQIPRPGDSVDADSNFEAIDMADELAGGPEWDT